MLGLVGISHCDKKPICINREETNCLVMKCLGGELSSQSNRGRVDAVPTYLLVASIPQLTLISGFETDLTKSLAGKDRRPKTSTILNRAWLRGSLRLKDR